MSFDLVQLYVVICLITAVNLHTDLALCSFQSVLCLQHPRNECLSPTLFLLKSTNGSLWDILQDRTVYCLCGCLGTVVHKEPSVLVSRYVPSK